MRQPTHTTTGPAGGPGDGGVGRRLRHPGAQRPADDAARCPPDPGSGDPDPRHRRAHRAAPAATRAARARADAGQGGSRGRQRRQQRWRRRRQRGQRRAASGAREQQRRARHAPAVPAGAVNIAGTVVPQGKGDRHPALRPLEHAGPRGDARGPAPVLLHHRSRGCGPTGATATSFPAVEPTVVGRALARHRRAGHGPAAGRRHARAGGRSLHLHRLRRRLGHHPGLVRRARWGTTTGDRTWRCSCAGG